MDYTNEIDYFYSQFNLKVMKTSVSNTKQMSVSEFKAHCTEELRAVENEGTTLLITRHGKIIAQINQPDLAESTTLADWIGSGGDLLNKSALSSFDEPTWQPEDWETRPSTSGDPLDNL